MNDQTKTENLDSIIRRIEKLLAIAERFGEMKTRETKTKVARGGAFSQGVIDGKAVSINVVIASSGNAKALN